MAFGNTNSWSGFPHKLSRDYNKAGNWTVYMIPDFCNKIGNVGEEDSELIQGSPDFPVIDPRDLFYLEPIQIQNARFQEVSPTPRKNSVPCTEPWHADFPYPSILCSILVLSVHLSFT